MINAAGKRDYFYNPVNAAKISDYNQQFIDNSKKQLSQSFTYRPYSDALNNDIWDCNKTTGSFLDDNNGCENYYSRRNSTASQFGVGSSSRVNEYLESNPEVDINRYGLSVNISSYETKMSGIEEVIYFKMDLFSSISKKRWMITHKYTDFFELNLIFEKYFTNPPLFVSNTGVVRLGAVSEILYKKELLNQYIKDVCSRPDLLTSIYCYKFFRLNHHYADITKYYPNELYCFKNELKLPISVSHFLPEGNLLFLGCGKRYKTVLESFWDKIKSFNPFASKFKSATVNASLNNNKYSQKVKGQFVVLNIIKNFQGKHHFEPLFAKPLYAECSSMNYFPDKNCLALGLANGAVNLYKIFINERTQETHGQLVIEAGSFAAFDKPIIGTVVNFRHGYIYVIAGETSVKIYELNFQAFVKEVPLTVKPISAMKFDDKNGLLILGDRGGRYYFVDLYEDPVNPLILKTFQGASQGEVVNIYVSPDRELMVISSDGGYINFYAITGYHSKRGINTDRKKHMRISNKYNVTDVIFTQRGELLCALDNGSIPVYYKGDDTPLFVIDAHLEAINNIFYDEISNRLISCSEDKSIRMVQLPPYYPAQVLKKMMQTGGVEEANLGNPVSYGNGEDENTDNANVEGRNEDKPPSMIICNKNPLSKACQIFSDDLDYWPIGLDPIAD